MAIEKNQKEFARKRRRFGRNKKPEYEQKLLDLARVTRVVKGGRRFSFRASVVIGNRKGKVGFGVAKGSDVSSAIGKAVTAAKKNMIIVKRTNTSIAFDVREKCGAAKVLIKPAKEGWGIVAGGAMRAVIELAGIKDIVAKSLGSSNKINVARATMKALSELEQSMTKMSVAKDKIKPEDMKSGAKQRKISKTKKQDSQR
ncbi:MAG: 30S ribosomal protein S5 [Patescibacteria group bacterium]|nr:30S ribosomal protein S5 [Patescibacteria group bacterium]